MSQATEQRVLVNLRVPAVPSAIVNLKRDEMFRSAPRSKYGDYDILQGPEHSAVRLKISVFIVQNEA